MNAPAKIEVATLASAMAAAFGEIEAATKSADNPAFKQGGKAIKYADLTSVIEAIKPALIAHGLFFTQHPEPSDKGVCVETVLHHAGGESLSLGKLFVPANRNDAQGFGSALTYARRYALVTAFGVPVEDDDGNAASKAAGGSGRDNTGDRTASPDTGTANQSQPREMPDAEWARLVQLIEATKTDTGKMIKHYGVKNLRQLNQEQYGNVLKVLNDRLAEMAKAETNKAAAGFGEELGDAIIF